MVCHNIHSLIYYTLSSPFFVMLIWQNPGSDHSRVSVHGPTQENMVADNFIARLAVLTLRYTIHLSLAVILYTYWSVNYPMPLSYTFSSLLKGLLSLAASLLSADDLAPFFTEKKKQSKKACYWLSHLPCLSMLIVLSIAREQITLKFSD